MKKNNLLIFLFVLITTNTFAQQWDAATCLDMCRILIENGSNAEEVLIDKLDYDYIASQDFDDLRTGYMFARNVKVDSNGRVLSIGKQGVSSVVMLKPSLYDPKYIIIFFSKTNIDIFRRQILDLGFEKLGTDRDGTHYFFDGVEITEYRDKSGNYSYIGFLFQLVN